MKQWSFFKRNISDSCTWEPCQNIFFFQRTVILLKCKPRKFILFWCFVLLLLVLFVCSFVCLFFSSWRNPWCLWVDLKGSLNLVLCFGRSSFEKPVVAIICRVSSQWSSAHVVTSTGGSIWGWSVLLNMTICRIH